MGDDLVTLLMALVGLSIVFGVVFACRWFLCPRQELQNKEAIRQKKIDRMYRNLNSKCHDEINDTIWDIAFPTVAYNSKKIKDDQ